MIIYLVFGYEKAEIFQISFTLLERCYTAIEQSINQLFYQFFFKSK